jgi:hypothetical protein
MKELLGGVSGGISRLVQAWWFPSLVAVGLFAYAIYPQIRTWPMLNGVQTLDSVERLALVGFASLLIAFLLAAGSTQLSRILEGYFIPAILAEPMRRRSLARRDKLIDELADAESPRFQQSAEELRLYPRSKYLLPTRFGNGLKAAETYGKERFGLDTPTFWSELVAVAPESLRDQLDDSRTVLDFFVALTWLSILFGLSSIAVSMIERSYAAMVTGLAATLTAPLFYRGAVSSVSWYYSAMTALVNVGRLELAKHIGVSLPARLSDEKELWSAVTDYVVWGDSWENSDRWISVWDARRSSEHEGELDQRGGD